MSPLRSELERHDRWVEKEREEDMSSNDNREGNDGNPILKNGKKTISLARLMTEKLVDGNLR